MGCLIEDEGNSSDSINVNGGDSMNSYYKEEEDSRGSTTSELAIRITDFTVINELEVSEINHTCNSYNLG